MNPDSTPTSPSAPAVELLGLRVALGKTTLLGPVDLAVEEGAHVLLVGPSGCGKTTLLRSVAGFVAPTEGAVQLGGRVVSSAGAVDVPPESRSVGMLFQGGALWPHMSAVKTLRFTAKHAGHPLDKTGALELLAAVHLEGKAKRRPAELSGGERQRLALARALAMRPRVLLLDEPLGPLDAELRGALLETLAELHARERWTMLHVTHDPDEALTHATRVVTLRDGQIVSDEHRSAAASPPEAAPTPAPTT